MPTTPGWPSTMFPRQPLVGGAGGEGRPPVETILIQFPPTGDESVAANSTVTSKMSVTRVLAIRLVVDIPAGVTAVLTVNGQRLINSQDGQGLVGQLEVGDASVPAGMRIESLAATIVNGLSAARDVRFWIVGVGI